MGKLKADELMLQYFPNCPLCQANSGYEVSGIFKNYVQCRSCGAKFESTDFQTGKELKKLELWEPCANGKGAELKRKKFDVHFWQDPNNIESEIQQLTPNKATTQQSIQDKTKLLFSEETKEEELKQKIWEDMNNLAMHESGTGWMQLGTFLTGSSADRMLASGFKALIDQNKIIIRQNELILRTLTKILTTSSPEKEK